MDWTPVESSNVAAVAYDADARKLSVRFRAGGTYHYHDVPANVHEELLNAPSAGSYVHSSLTPAFRYTRS